jgi:molybdate transport system ATP-binding protein
MCIDIDLRATIGTFTLCAAFKAPKRGICAVFGKSGSGKTALLRCISGLNRSCRGHVRLGDETWHDDTQELFLPAHRRRVGYVFQEAMLFPHLDVRHNLRYGMKRVARSDRKVGFDDTVTLLGLEQFLTRKPSTLSGGEKQRVALGRALLVSPRLLLLDEPVSALDRQGKAEVLSYVEHIRDQLDLPMLYVSHSVDEVSRLADHLVVMEQGAVLMAGPMESMRANPACPLTHGSEAGVTLSTTVLEHDEQYHLTYLSCGGGRIAVSRLEGTPGSRFRLAIKARDISISLSRPAGSSVLNSIPAIVTQVADDGPAHCLVCLSSEETPLVAHITRKSARLLNLSVGQAVFANVKSVALDE